MGVVGIVTTSLCAGEDVLLIISSTILPFSTDVPTTVSATNVSLINDLASKKLVFLCFKEAVNNISIDGGALLLVDI